MIILLIMNRLKNIKLKKIINSKNWKSQKEKKQKNIFWGHVGIEPTASRTQNENHTTRPMTHNYYMIIIRAPRIELGTYCVLSNRHNQLDQARLESMRYQKEKNKKKNIVASTGNRTRTSCLEGTNSNHWTIDASVIYYCTRL